MMHPHARSGGFTYLGMIILVAVIGMVGTATLKVGTLLQRAEAEEELLTIGAAFSDALASYAAATPPGQPQQPPSLQALLRDPRFPNARRHLRKVFIDPVTGKADWGLMTIGDKIGVVGVYSLSTARPLKIGNFDAKFLNFDNKDRLSDWKFTASGQGTLAPTPPGALAPPKMPVAPAVLPSAAAPASASTTAPEAVPAEVVPAEAPAPAEPAVEPVVPKPPEPQLPRPGRR